MIEYLKACTDDERHPSYISHLENLKDAQHMNRCELKKHITDALLEEAKYK